MKRITLNVRYFGKLTVTGFAALLMGTAIGCADGAAGDQEATNTGAVDSPAGDDTNDADGSGDKNSEEESGSGTR